METGRGKDINFPFLLFIERKRAGKKQKEREKRLLKQIVQETLRLLRKKLVKRSGATIMEPEYTPTKSRNRISITFRIESDTFHANLFFFFSAAEVLVYNKILL